MQINPRSSGKDMSNPLVTELREIFSKYKSHTAILGQSKNKQRYQVTYGEIELDAARVREKLRAFGVRDR